MWKYILILSFLLLLLIISKKEKFSWSCTYIPNKPYYNEDWILGKTPFADRMDAYIKQY
jgi:hypothetical protein